MSKKISTESEIKRFDPTGNQITFYIGVSLVILSIISSSYNLPKEYIFCSSISGGLFAIGDFCLLGIVNNKKSVLIDAIRALFFLFATLSIIVLPAILLSSPGLSESIGVDKLSDTITLFALGLIVCGYAMKAQDMENKKD